jgi:hypothetical protein
MALGPCLGQQIRKPFNEIFTVHIIRENFPTFDSSDHNMMQEAGDI